MAYLIYGMYKEGTEQSRASLVKGHFRHFLDRLSMVPWGGQLRSEGDVPIGSTFVLNCGTRAEVDAFLAADPYHQHALYGTVSITRIEVQLPEAYPGWLTAEYEKM